MESPQLSGYLLNYLGNRTSQWSHHHEVDLSLTTKRLKYKIYNGVTTIRWVSPQH